MSVRLVFLILRFSKIERMVRGTTLTEEIFIKGPHKDLRKDFRLSSFVHKNENSLTVTVLLSVFFCL